jgi:tRNA pseudouridine55 synthase
MTSHDVVARARRVLSVRRVGHAGTLDPMATGLLVLGVGAATRLLGYVGGHDKTYEATMRLGQSTVTDDREGEVLATTSTAHLGDAAVTAALAAQAGPLLQVPSSVSAVKVAGRRSYDRVRAGEEVVLEPRAVTVHRLDVHRVVRPTPDLVDVDVTVTCTAGTYVRAIARDAGAALGVGGHLTALRRTASGPFSVADAAPVEDAGQALAAGGGSGRARPRRRRPRRLPGPRAERGGGPRPRPRAAHPGHRRPRPARGDRRRRPAGRPRRGRRRHRPRRRGLPARLRKDPCRGPRWPSCRVPPRACEWRGAGGSSFSRAPPSR